MFVCVAYGGRFGHSGVILTGLGAKSCYLHLTGSSYPRQKFAIPSYESYLTDRVCIPSIEDGNPSGVSELNAYLYWQYYKVKTFNHPGHGKVWKERGREAAINNKYTNENHNCSLFANRLLIAACIDQGISTETDFATTAAWLFTGPIQTPRWFIRRARVVRDQILRKMQSDHVIPIYGYYLEEGVITASRKSCYSPESNIYGGHVEKLIYQKYTDLIKGVKENVERKLSASINAIEQEIEAQEKSKNPDTARLGVLYEARRTEKKDGFDQRLDIELDNPHRGMDPREKRGNEQIRAYHKHKWQDDIKKDAQKMHMPRGFERNDGSNEAYVKALELRFIAHGL